MPDDTASLPRGTVTFLFTDIEGSTELRRTLRTGYGDVRTEDGRLIEDVSPQRVFELIGDGSS